MPATFVDTSFWLALVDAKDRHHQAADDWLAGFDGRLVTTTDILDETVTAVSGRCGHEVARRLGDLLQRPDEVELVEIGAEIREAGWALFVARPDKRYSLTDCTSFVVMRHLGLHDAATFDGTFGKEGFQVVP